MKKLIALATLLFAFTINANAQDNKKMSSQDSAKKDVAAFNEKIKVSENLKKDMMTLMVMKYDQMNNNPNMSAAEKEKLAQAIQAKVTSALDDSQRKTLMNDPALLKQMTH